MIKDNSEEADLSQENGSEESTANPDTTQEEQDSGQQHDGQNDGEQQEGQSHEDYQAKLNATNRFLKKEGYEFQEGRWQKKADTTQQAEGSKEQKPAQPASLTRDEAILIAKGFSDEQLEKAKKIAAVENIPLTEVPNNDLYISWQTKRETEKKEQEAQLGVGRGGRRSNKKTFGTKGLTPDEHKELFKEKMGSSASIR
jgi:hypothetical protein